jgi:hypothetical protein
MIKYEVIPQLEKVIIESPRTPSSSPAQTISDVPTWQTFHRTIYPIIEEWIATSPQGHIAYAWSTAIDEEVNAQSSWSEVKTAMNINTFRDYYHYIANSQPITKKVKLHLDNSSGVIHYRLLGIQPNTITPPVRSENNLELPDLEATANVDLKPPDLNIPHQNSTIIPINQSVQERSQVSSETKGTTEMTNIPQGWPDEHKSTDEDRIPISPADNGFSLTHSVVYHKMEAWSRLPQSKNHYFYPKWVEAKYKNLSPTSTWSDTCRILKIESLDEYVSFAYNCPRIIETMDIHHEPKMARLAYSIKQTPVPDDIN